MNEQPRAAQPKIERRGRWSRLAGRLALLAGSVLLTLACLEIGLRLFTDVAPSLSEKDALIGRRYVRSFEGDVFIPEAGRKVALRFNDVGFRGPNRPNEKPPGVRRVAVIGDSMVASLAVEESQTMVCQLERLLNASPGGATWEVLNFGVDGASPGQELVLYREVVSRFQPDVVLDAFCVGNDLADNCSRLSSNPRLYFDLDEAGQLRREPFSARRATVSQFLNRHSRLYVWQRTAANQARHSVHEQMSMMEPGYWVYSKEPPPDVVHAWELTARIYATFHQEVEARGSRFGVVVMPSAPQVYQDAFTDLAARAGKAGGAFDPDYPDRRLAEICHAAGIPFLSMLADFRQAAPSGSSQMREEWLFCGGKGHLTEQGNALAARLIHRFLTAYSPPEVALRPLIGTLR